MNFTWKDTMVSVISSFNFWVIDLLHVSFCMKFVTYCSCHAALFFLKSTGQLYSKASSVVELGWLVTSELLTSCPVPIHYYIVIDMLLSFVHFNTWLFWVSLYRTRVWISLYDWVLGWNSIRFTLAVCFVFKFEPHRFWLFIIVWKMNCQLISKENRTCYISAIHLARIFNAVIIYLIVWADFLSSFSARVIFLTFGQFQYTLLYVLFLSIWII
jgi:hypothetical protein